MNLLVIDDDELTNYLIMNILDECHYIGKYKIVTSGWDGLDWLDEKEIDEFPDLILLDLRMPEMDGFQFIEYISKNDNESAKKLVSINSKLKNEYEFNGVTNEIFKIIKIREKPQKSSVKVDYEATKLIENSLTIVEYPFSKKDGQYPIILQFRIFNSTLNDEKGKIKEIHIKYK